MSKYHATKFFIDENYQVNYHPTEIFDSIEQVFDCAQGFLIIKNYIQQVKRGRMNHTSNVLKMIQN